MNPKPTRAPAARVAVVTGAGSGIGRAVALGLLPASVRVVAVTTAEYPTVARRPVYGVLEKRATIAALGKTPVHWRVNLRAVMSKVVIE